MNNCVSKNSADFKSLYKEVFGIDNVDAGLEQILAAKISSWQDENGLDKWPLASDMRAQMTGQATMAYIKEKSGLESLKMSQGESVSNGIKEGVPELFESNPELANAVYEALGLNNINESEITYTDEEGNPCAKMGLTNTVKGTGWKIVKDFKGKPKHSYGGVDITISDKGVSMRRGGKDIKAKYGLLIPNNN